MVMAPLCGKIAILVSYWFIKAFGEPQALYRTSEKSTKKIVGCCSGIKSILDL